MSNPMRLAKQVPTKRKLKGGANLYKRGAALERRVKAKLEQLGWVCFRVAGSRGPADLIAGQPSDPFKTGRLVFIQVKRNGETTLAERNDLGIQAHRLKAEAVIVDGQYRVRAVDRWEEGWSRWDETF